MLIKFVLSMLSKVQHFKKHVFGGYANFLNNLCSKFVSDIVMLVSSSLAMRERGSERARFEILSAEHR